MDFSHYLPTPPYSNFKPSPPTKEEREEEIKLINIRQENIKKYAKDNELIQLKTDGYWGMDYFYYSEKYKRMYRVNSYSSETDTPEKPIFQLSTDDYILKINDIEYIEEII
jgi:hypothetical protein